MSWPTVPHPPFQPRGWSNCAMQGNLMVLLKLCLEMKRWEGQFSLSGIWPWYTSPRPLLSSPEPTLYYRHHHHHHHHHYWFLEREGGREKEREKRWFVYPCIYAFIGWFLYVPWLGIEPVTLACQDNTLTNWATWPGLLSLPLSPTPLKLSISKSPVTFNIC